MKKILLSLVALMAGFGFKAEATHDIGGSLTYICVAPNVYNVTYSHYSWYAISNTQTLNMKISAPGCNAGRVVPLLFSSSQLGGLLPDQNGLTPYYLNELTATVTFSAAEATCKDWVMSVMHGSRTRGSNLTATASALDLYTESALNLEAGINNSSPVFDALNDAILIAAPKQLNTLSVGAFDVDGDSLVYHMVSPLEAENQPVGSYRNFSGSFIPNPNPLPPYTTTPPNIQVAQLPGRFTYDFPLFSINPDWNALNPATGIPYPIVSGNPYFDLDEQSGSLSFKPIPTDSLNSMFPNFYLVAYKVDEYRKINGVVTKIGSIRRESFIKLGAQTTNLSPRVSGMHVNNVPAQANAVYYVKPGNTISIQLDGADNNAADSVYLASNAATVLPGATFTTNNAAQQSGTVTWTPSASALRDQPYYLRIRVKDNASPVAATHVETIAIKVSNSSSTTGLKPNLAKTASFMAYPNPFSETVRFRFDAQSKAETIIIYNLLGQPVDQISISENASGKQEIQWKNAGKYAAGIYVAKLIAADKTIQTLKFTKLQ